jgi:acyl-CoA synthetase (AMP-forming)/AMP-acid ligase II
MSGPFHPSVHAANAPDRLAVVTPATGESRTYAELEANSNRIASLLRARGLQRGDVVAVMMTNDVAWYEVIWGVLRCGLYVVPVNWHLSAKETAYIVADCEAKALITSTDLADTIVALGDVTDSVPLKLSVGGALPGFESLEEATEGLSETASADDVEGSWMFYSSGTTGQPKGIKPDLPTIEFGDMNPLVGLISGLYGLQPDSVYLSPAPLYHAAPAGWSTTVHRIGGTVVVMDRFDPLEWMRLVEEHKVTHTQVVPTYLVRLLKLAEATRARYDVSSLEMVVHAAAPCPPEVKRAALDWLGLIVYEYYAASEGTGFCAIGPQEWLDHPGSVGRSLLGAVHIVDEDGNEVAVGEEGEIWFEAIHRFSYHGDPEKTARAFNDKGWNSIGDIGRLDEEGYVYLTDRVSNMIISGGVNIYPREAEDVLVGHFAVDDVAVIGTPDEVMGEKVTAFVQLREGEVGTPKLADELIGYCRDRLSHFKCPREVRFVESLPRLPNGKLLKRMLTASS